jgi:6-phosphofructokinase 2
MPTQATLAPIVTLTLNPTVDTSTAVGQVIPDRKLRCSPPRYDPGGGGINVARAISKLGGKARAVFPAGGLYGDLLRQLLEAEQIDHHAVEIAGSTRDNLIVLEESTNRQYRFGMPGARLSAEEVRQCLEACFDEEEKPGYIVASGSLPPGTPVEVFAQLADLASGEGSRLVVDTSGEALRHAAERGAFLLKPNYRELSELTGEEIQTEAQPEALARSIIERGKVEVLVASLGSTGALLVTREGVEHLISPTVPIRSRVGAGDSMVAGIVLSLARGQSLKEAVRFGVAAGAAAVMTPGTELCRREDTERIYSAMELRA